MRRVINNFYLILQNRVDKLSINKHGDEDIMRSRKPYF